MPEYAENVLGFGYSKEDAKRLAAEGKIKLYMYVYDGMLDKYFSFTSCKKMKLPVTVEECKDIKVFACSRMAAPHGSPYIPLFKRDQIEIRQQKKYSYENYLSTMFFLNDKEIEFNR